MAEHANKERKDSAMLLALAAGDSIQAAAEKAGVSERTVSRRLRSLAFRRKLMELRSRVLEIAAARLAGGMATAAMDRLSGLIGSKSEQVALQASQTVLNLAARLSHGVEERLQLERVLRQMDKVKEERPELFRGAKHGDGHE